ncbi:hypothetical protein V8C86DRAFT_1451560 [Haematococcus lacustris]
MKFCALLFQLATNSGHFLCLHAIYKQAKKAIKGLASYDRSEHAEAQFSSWLVLAIERLSVLRNDSQAQAQATLTRLETETQRALRHGASVDEQQTVYSRAVQFHGEALQLMNWSILAYTCIIKILKKHLKRTGMLLQAPQLRTTLSAPSWSTQVWPCA